MEHRVKRGGILKEKGGTDPCRAIIAAKVALATKANPWTLTGFERDFGVMKRSGESPIQFNPLANAMLRRSTPARAATFPSLRVSPTLSPGVTTVLWENPRRFLIAAIGTTTVGK
jgi:hypothetical protein